MRCFSLLLLLRLALAAPTQAPSDFNIVNLYAQVIPHSASSSCTLTNGEQQLLLRPKHHQQHPRNLVHRSPLTASNGELVNVTRTPCADDARYTWAWTILTTTSSSSSSKSDSDTEKADTSSTANTTCNIEYWFDGPGYSLYASHHVPADQIIWTNQQSPTGTVQAYAGPANFTVPVARVY
ncbi:hypothetical protein PG997_000161 [Apiospora hydei]|uniref:AA1-like domain-containing protein n=1 Tax=Apiospora hydei TaxID=1337664 RepID=A0ABR1XA08_9PEZI